MLGIFAKKLKSYFAKPSKFSSSRHQRKSCQFIEISLQRRLQTQEESKAELEGIQISLLHNSNRLPAKAFRSAGFSMRGKGRTCSSKLRGCKDTAMPKKRIKANQLKEWVESWKIRPPRGTSSTGNFTSRCRSRLQRRQRCPAQT